MNDFELIQGCIEKDKAAWDAFVEKFARLICCTIHRTFAFYGRPIGERVKEDLLQDVFVYLCEDNGRSFRAFQGKNGCKFSSYLSVITQRKAIDYLRKLKTDCLSSGIPDEGVLTERPDTGQTIDETLEQQDFVETAEDLLAHLQNQEAHLCRLFFFQQKSPESIAKELGISVDYFYVMKKRVLSKLKAMSGPMQMQ